MPSFRCAMLPLPAPCCPLPLFFFRITIITLKEMRSRQIWWRTYVTLEWPLVLHFTFHIGCVAHNLCNAPSEIFSARETALKMLFREQKCPFSSSSTMPFFNPGQNTLIAIDIVETSSWPNSFWGIQLCFFSSTFNKHSTFNVSPGAMIPTRESELRNYSDSNSRVRIGCC